MISRHREFIDIPRESALLAVLLAALASPALADDAGPPAAASMEELKRQVADQTRRLEQLRQALAEEESKLQKLRSAVGMETLSAARGGQGSGQPLLAQGTDDRAPAPVGQRPQPSPEASRPQVAQIFEQPGILTPRGKFTLEPSLQYSYSSNNRVALVGYTIIPAITIGLIDVREVRRNTLTAALTGRWGVTNRFELEAKVPWLYRTDDSIRRPLATGAATDDVFSTSGKGLGDIELTGRYQLNEGGLEKPYYVASLRFKTRTGKDPFGLKYLSIPGYEGLGLLKEQATGSGFYTLQPGLTVLYPSDPAVLFGGISYQYNFKRNGLDLKTDTGTGIVTQHLDSIQAGNALQFNFGMGLALNERSSFSIGYDHLSVERTRINGSRDPLSVRTQLGTLLLGYSYRLNPSTVLNASVGVGVTRDSPDVQLTVRLPMSF